MDDDNLLMSNSAPVSRVSDTDFQKQVLESPTPAVVVFEKKCWGTAHIMRSTIEKISTEYLNKIKVFRYDLEENSSIAEYYRVENCISILIFNKGNVVDKTGFVSKEELEKLINTCLNISADH